MFTIIDGRKHFSNEIKNAFKSYNNEAISMLIEGVNLAEIRDYRDMTLLHLMIRYDFADWKIINYLIKNGCNINAQDRTGTTPILGAVKKCNRAMMIALLTAKADVFLSDNEGINALNAILTSGQWNRISRIQWFAKYLKESELNAHELAPLLIKAGWPIHYAICIGSSKLLKLMIETGCPINSRDAETGYTALHMAIYLADLESTKILLQNGADVDIVHEITESPFELVTTIGTRTKANIFETFLEYPSLLQRFNIDGMIKSYASFTCADAQIIELLEKYKINLTTKDRSGSTLLHYLVLNTSREAIDLISKAEVNVNIKDNHGNTPLHYVVGFPCNECLISLIAKGADVNAKNENGHTPLITAISYYAQADQIEILINNGTILNEKIQNLVLDKVAEKNTDAVDINSILKRMAIMHLQLEVISTRNMHLIKKNPSIDALFESYLQELNFMKQKHITVNSNISVFDILCFSEHQLLNCARNEEIATNLFEIDICCKYPIFGELVVSQFQVAHNYHILTQNAINMLAENIKQLNCNLEIIEYIIKFLSQNDLVTLLKE